MGVEYFSLRFGVASPFLLKRTRVFLCLWSKPWFWKPEGLLFDSVEEQPVLACEWKNNCLCDAGFERVRRRLDRHCYACWWHTAALGQQQTTNQRTKLICNGCRMCVYLYVCIYIHKSHMCCAHTHRVKRKNSICRQVPWAVCRLVSMKRLFSPKKAGS